MCMTKKGQVWHGLGRALGYKGPRRCGMGIRECTKWNARESSRDETTLLEADGVEEDIGLHIGGKRKGSG